MRRARGFTVLETLLASIMGSLLVAVVVGLLAMVDRTERLTSRRERDTATVAQLHMVMDRTFGSLVMKDGVTLAPQTNSPSRPRMVLEGDASARGAKPPAADLPLQRLEVVVEKSPVPPGWGGGPLADTSYQADDPEIISTRGVFEVRPGRGKEGAADGTWSLWWRPLPPTAEGNDGAAFRAQPGEDQRAVVVADGLTECQWMAFKNRERSGAIAVTKFDDLPAYMEMQVATASGITANWMFEVQWTNGPETGAEAEMMAAAQAQAQQGGGPGADQSKGGGPGASGATGAGAPGVPGGPVAKPAPGVAPSAVPAAVLKPSLAPGDNGAKGAKQKKRVTDPSVDRVPR